MESNTERLLRYLEDAWAVEKALVSSLQDMAASVNDTSLSALFEEHRQVTLGQEARLESRIRALGGQPNKGKGLLNSAMSKFSEMMNAFHDENDRTAQTMIKAYAVENFECAMYQALATYATSISDGETASLAQMHIQQEKEAANKVWEKIVQVAERPAAVAA